jgi:Rieske Fe-S protein
VGSVGPLRAATLDPEEEYVFVYPFASTPCLLLDLGRPLPPVEVPLGGRNGGYAWAGGVGPRQSLVAFTAICPHQLAHPEKALSAVAYHRAGQKATMVGGRDRLIVCCLHFSAFDPAAGGRLEQGPAEVPLAGITLEWDGGRDELYASGVLGVSSFERFFREVRGKSRAAVEGETAVMRLRDHSAVVARC